MMFEIYLYFFRVFRVFCGQNFLILLCKKNKDFVGNNIECKDIREHSCRFVVKFFFMVCYRCPEITNLKVN